VERGRHLADYAARLAGIFAETPIEIGEY